MLFSPRHKSTSPQKPNRRYHVPYPRLGYHFHSNYTVSDLDLHFSPSQFYLGTSLLTSASAAFPGSRRPNGHCSLSHDHLIYFLHPSADVVFPFLTAGVIAGRIAPRSHIFDSLPPVIRYLDSSPPLNVSPSLPRSLLSDGMRQDLKRAVKNSYRQLLLIPRNG